MRIGNIVDMDDAVVHVAGDFVRDVIERGFQIVAQRAEAIIDLKFRRFATCGPMRECFEEREHLVETRGYAVEVIPRFLGRKARAFAIQLRKRFASSRNAHVVCCAVSASACAS